MSDPISDMLTQIRNAQKVGHLKVILPFSKVKFALAEILKRQGYIEDVSKRGKRARKSIRIVLKYTDEVPQIQGIRRISKPGRRIYKKATQLRPILQGLGIAIISTPLGLMTDKEARKKRVGGEVVCEVW